jgi:glucokinase
MLLAGDVGGTKTLLGLFERADRRPVPVATHSYVTNTYASFTEILQQFAADVGKRPAIEAAAFGVAGPVVANRARLTNIVWNIDAAEVTEAFETTRVRLLNDLEAMAHSVDLLAADELIVLQEGVPRADGNAAVIAAGTGLGQALLHRVDGRLLPLATEAGHADLAARTDREMELVRMLRELYGRAEVEHVLSGPGLVNLHRFSHRGGECALVADLTDPNAPARISQAALGGRCQGCSDALQMFVAIYGAESGNLALRSMATSGVFVGGGIAPKILPALRSGIFLEAFRAKPPLSELLSRTPVSVIMNSEAGLLGAAVYAMNMPPMS